MTNALPRREPRESRLRRPNDLRVIKSRAALREALLRLLQDRPLEQIAIKEITTAAGVSYPVFFRQFASREELLADLAQEEVRGLMQHTVSSFDFTHPAANLASLCDYVQQRRALWRSLLTTGAAPVMRAEFARLSSEMGEVGPRVNPWLPIPLASAITSSGIFEVLAWWLNQREDYPISNVVKMLEVLIVRPIGTPQDVQLD